MSIYRREKKQALMCREEVRRERAVSSGKKKNREVCYSIERERE